jgi:dTDP-4-amino-4,6-dideoxygalactose transaminase
LVSEEDVLAVSEVLRSDWLTIGPTGELFELELSAAIGGTAAIAVSSGTAALHASYAAIGLGPGDEVIVPPITFAATLAAAVQLGARPVIVDIQADTGNIDPVQVSAAISSRTKAIVAVDFAGHPADLDELNAIAKQHGVFLIEDAAHSLGSRYRGRQIGSVADITTFSFFPTKNIAAGEGGAIASLNTELLERARLFSRQGIVREPARLESADEGPWHQEVQAIALNYRLSDIHAALARSQLRRLDSARSERKGIKSRYDEAFSGVEGILCPSERAYVEPMWHLYPIRVPAEERRAIFETLQSKGVRVQVNYLPAHKHPALQSHVRVESDPVNAQEFYEREISLPMYVGLTKDDQNLVIEAVLGCC